MKRATRYVIGLGLRLRKLQPGVHLRRGVDLKHGRGGARGRAGGRRRLQHRPCL